MAYGGFQRLGVICIQQVNLVKRREGACLARGFSSKSRLLLAEVEPATATTTAPPLPPKKPPSTSSGNAITITLLTLGLAGAGYYYYVTQVEPQSTANLPPPPEEVKPLPTIVIDVVPPPLPPPPIPATSARDELLITEQRLQQELEELRKQKRDKLIDLKKKEIKEELKIIAKGLKDLDSKK